MCLRVMHSAAASALVTTQTHHAVLELLRDLPRAPQVARVKVGGQAVLGVVGQHHRLVVATKPARVCGWCVWPRRADRPGGGHASVLARATAADRAAAAARGAAASLT
jgi:hypothetical protein